MKQKKKRGGDQCIYPDKTLIKQCFCKPFPPIKVDESVLYVLKLPITEYEYLCADG